MSARGERFVIHECFVAAMAFHGMSASEGPLPPAKSVNALPHRTDWAIARVDAEAHARIGAIGTLLRMVPIHAEDLTPGLIWRAFDESGRLAFPDVVETMVRLIPMDAVRVSGGAPSVAGLVRCLVSMLMTREARPTRYAEPVRAAPACEDGYPATERATGGLRRAPWHRRWARPTVTLTPGWRKGCNTCRSQRGRPIRAALSVVATRAARPRRRRAGRGRTGTAGRPLHGGADRPGGRADPLPDTGGIPQPP